MIVLEIVIAILGLSGFLLANYIKDTKKEAVPLVCPMEGSCESVIQSNYSKFLGVPVETLGILYYGLIFLTYALLAIFPQYLPDIVTTLILSFTICAMVFSIYLTAVQSFILKHWCTWCLISAGICTLIFIFSAIIWSEKIITLFQSL